MTTFHSILSKIGLLPGLALIAGALMLAVAPNQARAAVVDSSGLPAGPASLPTPPSYADLVDLIEPATLVLVVQLRKVASVEPERAKDVRTGWARIYVEARVVAALRGTALLAGGPLLATVSYLADVQLDEKGKLPALGKHTMMLVARPVASHPEMVQLVAPDAQLPWDPAAEARVRAVLAALQAPAAPSPVTTVRETIHVPGALVGQGETQIFLATADGSPAAISVVHQPGKQASWSVSFSEVVDASGQPPAHDTLAWYRLACFLPGQLPEGSNVSATAEDRAQAAQDYDLVMAELGPCGRTRN